MPRITLKVLAADPVSRAGVEAQLHFRPEFEFVDRAAPADVSVIVADSLDGDVIDWIRNQRRSEGARVVLICGRLNDDEVLAAIEAGASALLRRSDVTEDKLARAVTAAVAGDGNLPPDMLGRLLENVGAAQRHYLGSGLRLTTLSNREREVLSLVADGHSTGEIAKALAYSERTIKSAIHDLITRLQLRNRSHAVAFAVREGLI